MKQCSKKIYKVLQRQNGLKELLDGDVPLDAVDVLIQQAAKSMVRW